MKCPYCSVDNDKVIDSRSSNDGFSIRRRRECLGCQRRYTTYERLEQTLKVIKKDGSREIFEPEKIRAGLEKACWKRPIGDQQIRSLIEDVERDVYDRFELEIPSHEVGEMIMERLKNLDQVAYVRFASVYRQFKDVRDFVHELQPMLDQNAEQRHR
jgi:transcriptional repressor NrdR